MINVLLATLPYTIPCIILFIICVFLDCGPGAVASLFLMWISVSVGFVSPCSDNTETKSYKVAYTTNFKDTAVDINSNQNTLKYIDTKGKVKKLNFNENTKINYIDSKNQKIEYTTKKYFNSNKDFLGEAIQSITIYQKANS